MRTTILVLLWVVTTIHLRERDALADDCFGVEWVRIPKCPVEMKAIPGECQVILDARKKVLSEKLKERCKAQGCTSAEKLICDYLFGPTMINSKVAAAACTDQLATAREKLEKLEQALELERKKVAELRKSQPPKLQGGAATKQPLPAEQKKKEDTGLDRKKTLQGLGITLAALGGIGLATCAGFGVGSYVLFNETGSSVPFDARLHERANIFMGLAIGFGVYGLTHGLGSIGVFVHRAKRR